MRVSSIGICISLVASLFGGVRSAQACGGLVQPVGGTVGLNAQRAFISVRANGTTDVVLYISVPDASNDFGVVLPAPSLPALASAPVDAAELDALEESTRPAIFSPSSSSSGGGGCGCGAKAGLDSSRVAGDGVVVGQTVNLGPVTAVSLMADNGTALTGWLTSNGFTVPASAQPVVDSYAAPGQWFVALKRTSSAPSASAITLGMRMNLTGDHRDFAVKMASLGAAASVAINVFVVAPHGVGPASPYSALTLDDLDASVIKAGGYKAAVTRAVTAAGGHAFVVEGVYDAATIQGPTLATLVDDHSMLTRLSTIMDPAHMDRDVAFTASAPGRVPTSVHLTSLGAQFTGHNVMLANSFTSSTGMLLLGLWGAAYVVSAFKKRARR